MDVTTLHTATESLAETLSEVTQGDLRQPIPPHKWDIGDLYVRLVDQGLAIASGLAPEPHSDARSRADTITRPALDVAANLYGGGYEERYRRTAQLAEDAFTSVGDEHATYGIGGVTLSARAWYEKQVNETVLYTWDLARAMGFAYRPPAEVVFEVLRTQPEPTRDDVESAWDVALRRSRRNPG